MLKFIKVIGLVLLTLVAILIVSGYFYIKNFDLNEYKHFVTSLVQKELGRELVIKGNASIGISFSPTLIVEDVELANPAWSKNPSMIKVKKLELKFSLKPLLEKQIVLDKVIFDNPQIFLEKSIDNKVNWDFSIPKQKSANNLSDVSDVKTITMAKNNSANKNPMSVILAGFSLKNFAINNGLVSYVDAKNNQNYDVILKSIVMSAPSVTEPMNAEFDVVYDNKELAGQLKIGSIKQLMNKENPYPIDLKAEVLGVNVAVNGVVTDILSGDIGYSFKTNIVNPVANLGMPEVKLDAVIAGSADKIKVDISGLNSGNSKLSGVVNVNLTNEKPYISADISSPNIDIPNISQSLKIASYIPSFISSANASKLVPNTEVDYGILNMLNSVINVKIDNFVIDDGLVAKNVSAKISVVNGVLDIRPLNLGFGQGVVSASVYANANNQTVKIKINSEGIRLQDLHKEFLVSNKHDFGVLSGGDLLLDVNLSTSGKTYNQLYEKLDGTSVVLLSPSKIQSGDLNFMTGNFITQLLKALNINVKKETSIKLKCGVIRSNFGQGKINFPNGIALHSSKLNLISNGSISLINDKINFNIKPFSGKVIDTNVAQALASFVSVKGVLNKPKIGVNEKEALKTLVGAFATGGVSYLGSKLILEAETAPCYTALEGTRYQSMVPKPSKTERVKTDVTKGASKTIDKSIARINNTANDVINIFKGF